MENNDVTPVTLPSKRSWIKRTATYGGAFATAFIAVYGATKPEEAAQRAIIQNTVSHEALANQVRDLQKWARFNRQRSKSAETICKARVEALSSFVTGFLLGLNRQVSSPANRLQRRNDAVPTAVDALVKALGQQPKPKPTSTKGLPVLKNTSPVKKLIQSYHNRKKGS